MIKKFNHNVWISLSIADFHHESFLVLSSEKLKIHDLFAASRGERSEVVLNECWTSDEKFDNESFE